MAVNHALHTPFKSNELKAGELQLALVKHVPYGIDDASEAAALDATGLGIRHIVFGNDLYRYDSTDTVTIADDATCLVTADGKRFKNDSARVKGTSIFAVDDDDLVAPPGSPAIGDSHLLPAAPTGDWAAYGKHVAVYTQRGWVFIAPRPGMLAYVADEDAYRRFDATNWVSGFGSAAITDGALKAAKLEQAYGWRVESETATPPASIPAAGTLYIVGASATGAWVGEDGNIARSTGTVWEFETAVEGMTVFNKGLGYNVSYKSGSWQAGRPSGLLIYKSAKLTASSLSFGQTYTQLLSLGTHTGLSTSNRIIAPISFDYISATGANTVGLFIDTETTPRQSRAMGNVQNLWRAIGVGMTFEMDVPDTSSHTYAIKAIGAAANTTVEYIEGYLEEVSG